MSERAAHVGQSDSRGSGWSDEEKEARRRYRSLHRRPSYGYERGDCHCHECGETLDFLVAFFGLKPPPAGVFDPAASVRAEALERWRYTT